MEIGDPHSSEDNARVEINIWVQAPLDKVLITGGHMLKLHSNLQQLISTANHQHGVGAGSPRQPGQISLWGMHNCLNNCIDIAYMLVSLN